MSAQHLGNMKNEDFPIFLSNLSSNRVSVTHRNLEYLFLSDLPGLKDKQKTVDRLQTALPRLDVALDLD